MKDHDPDLRAATTRASSDELARLASSRATVVIGGGGLASVQVAGVVHDQDESRSLVELSQSDPGRALASLSAIQDPAIKVRTQAGIARKLINSDPAQAAAILESAWGDSDKILDTKEHIVALEIIADAWSNLNDPSHVRSVVSDGLSLAQQMYSASKNQKVDFFLLRPGVDELGSLAGLLARVDPQASIELAQNVDSPEARAYVLLSIARALLNPQLTSQSKS